MNLKPADTYGLSKAALLVRKYYLLFALSLFLLSLLCVSAFSNDFFDQKPDLKNMLSSVSGGLLVASILLMLQKWFFPPAEQTPDPLTIAAEEIGLDAIHHSLAEFGGTESWQRLLEDSSAKVDLMGRSLGAWTRIPNLPDLLSKKIRDGVTFRWLIMGPDCEFALALKEGGQPLHSILEPKTKETLKVLRNTFSGLPEEYRDRLQLRYCYTSPLLFNLARIDSRILVTHYLSTHDVQECLCLDLCNLTRTWPNNLVREFESLWTQSAPVDLKHAEGDRTDLQQEVLKSLFLQHREDRESAVEENRVSMHNFKKGWDTLFFLLSKSRAQPIEESILRDFTISSHGPLSLEDWDFMTYPQRIRDYLQNARGERHLRFLISCNVAGERNAAAEEYLRRILGILYRRKDIAFAPVFEQWKGDASRDGRAIQIRITNRQIIDRVCGVHFNGEKFLNSPQNIYGDIAVSKSILDREDKPSRPVPFLEIYWSKKEVLRQTRVFDSVWKASQVMQDAIWSTGAAELHRAGSGQLFDSWAALK